MNVPPFLEKSFHQEEDERRGKALKQEKLPRCHILRDISLLRSSHNYWPIRTCWSKDADMIETPGSTSGSLQMQHALTAQKTKAVVLDVVKGSLAYQWDYNHSVSPENMNRDQQKYCVYVKILKFRLNGG